MNKTKIEWVKNPDGTPGYTWNPITGCNNQVDGLCGGKFPCYAYKLANTRLKERYLANKNTATQNYDEDSYAFTPRLWEDKLLEPYFRKGNQGIFTCSMSDLFGIGVPDGWTRQVLDTITRCFNHRFYILTKQPQNLIKFSPFPDNCYVGVSVTNCQQMYDSWGYLEDLMGMKFISFEPLLGSIQPDLFDMLKLSGVKWVIIGAQTKPTVMPKVEWVQEIVEAADKVGIPVFLKDSLIPLTKYPVPKDELCIYEFEKGNFKLRQEMPK